MFAVLKIITRCHFKQITFEECAMSSRCSSSQCNTVYPDMHLLVIFTCLRSVSDVSIKNDSIIVFAAGFKD